MSTEFAPVAVAKWEQELIDSVKITKSVQLDKVPCDWCYAPATWKIVDELGAYQGYANACTAHGREWYPEAFPESDTTPVEPTTERYTCGICLVDQHTWSALDAHWDTDCQPTETARVSPVGVKATFKYPWYPLMAHRDGLRRNDPGTLASALFIVSLEGGTAHHGHCNGVAGEGCGICEGRL